MTSSHVPPPVSSPTPPLPAEEKTDPGAVVTVGAMKHELRKNEIFTVASAVAVGLVALLGGLGAGVLFVEQKAEAAGRSAADEVAKDQKTLREEVQRYKEITDASFRDIRQDLAANKQETVETRGDIHALYLWQKYGGRSERLEKPLPGIDGGR